MYRGYEEELYRFDQLYRHFCEAADEAESQGWNVLKPLRESIEACYTNWFVPNLALVWGKFVEPQGPTHLLTKWQVDQVPNQQDFFEHYVRPRLNEAENRRVEPMPWFGALAFPFRFLPGGRIPLRQFSGSAQADNTGVLTGWRFWSRSTHTAWIS